MKNSGKIVYNYGKWITQKRQEVANVRRETSYYVFRYTFHNYAGKLEGWEAKWL